MMFSSRFFFSLLLLLTLLTGAMAQQQAPITWEQPRRIPGSEQYLSRAFGFGDTIVLVGNYYTREGHRRFNIVRVSSNNGQTWTPWHLLSSDTTTTREDKAPSVALSSHGIFVTEKDNPPNRNGFFGIYRSTDFGVSWEPPAIRCIYLELQRSKSDTVFYTSIYDTLFWTVDGVVSHAMSPFRPDTLASINIWSTYVNGWAYVLFPSLHPSNFHNTLYFTKARFPDGVFPQPQPIDPIALNLENGAFDFDETGTGIVMSAIDYDDNSPQAAGIHNYTTRDNGTTWSPPDTVIPFESTNYLPHLIRNNGKLWVEVWHDTVHYPPYQQPPTQFQVDVCYRFSANSGMSWYPTREIYPIGWETLGEINGLDVFGNRINVYAAFSLLHNTPGKFTMQATGTITPDTLTPIVRSYVLLPEQLTPQQSSVLQLQAVDNDSVWRVRAVVSRIGSNDSTIHAIPRQSDSTYSTTYLAPSDTGQYRYYYLVEDMWGHRSRIPQTPNTYWNFQVVSSDVSENNPIVSEYVVSIYPNPSNGAATITATLPIGVDDAAITIHDILGREVYRSESMRRDASGKVSLVWNASLGQSNGQSQIPVSSGIYFVQLRAGSYQKITKITLLQ